MKRFAQFNRGRLFKTTPTFSAWEHAAVNNGASRDVNAAHPSTPREARPNGTT